jgi:hypothetical protein
MAIQTQVLFNGKLDPEDYNLIQAQADSCVAAGTTDGVITYDPDTATVQGPGVKVERTWTTQQAAEDWITFISTFNPASAVIVNV